MTQTLHAHTNIIKIFLKTQFSQGNNVLDAPASDTNGFLWRDTCVFSTQLKRPIWKKESLSAL
jgi:hypothetical protein